MFLVSSNDLRNVYSYKSKLYNSYSQAMQDIFVRTSLDNKSHGYFLEIGSNESIFISNTFALEQEFNWTGLMIDYNSDYASQYSKYRKSPYLILDATLVDYKSELEKLNFPHVCDYLQIDLEVSNKSTIATLEKLATDIFPHYKFATVTFEHDFYTGNFHNTRAKSREIFAANGYQLLHSDVLISGLSFEDWYIHPSVVTKKIQPTHNTEYSDIFKNL